ncbi:hypothetical protein MPER_04195 [Moniliophthora perniciosa FA553]|nr:hypothetical protein MPER_04195 [Moniliophthora perniciosa FA553]
MSSSSSPSPNEKTSIDKHEDTGSVSMKENAPAATNENAKLANPLRDLGHDKLIQDAKVFAETHGMEDLVLDFQKGALVAQDPTAFESLSMLTEEDKELLRRESTHKWSHPITLYYLVVLCSMAAAVQGMDEAVINGANIFFTSQFGIDPNTEDVALQGRNQWLLGLVNSAPYLCCAVLGCWLTDPLNRYLGRRGTIFVTAIFSFITCIWQGLTNSWWHLFISRFVLGIGIGPKSATVPVYAAECAPPAIRGALVMMCSLPSKHGLVFGL